MLHALSQQFVVGAGWNHWSVESQLRHSGALPAQVGGRHTVHGGSTDGVHPADVPTGTAAVARQAGRGRVVCSLHRSVIMGCLAAT